MINPLGFTYIMQQWLGHISNRVYNWYFVGVPLGSWCNQLAYWGLNASIPVTFRIPCGRRTTTFVRSTIIVLFLLRCCTRYIIPNPFYTRQTTKQAITRGSVSSFWVIASDQSMINSMANLPTEAGARAYCDNHLVPYQVRGRFTLAWDPDAASDQRIQIVMSLSNPSGWPTMLENSCQPIPMEFG